MTVTEEFDPLVGKRVVAVLAGVETHTDDVCLVLDDGSRLHITASANDGASLEADVLSAGEWHEKLRLRDEQLARERERTRRLMTAPVESLSPFERMFRESYEQMRTDLNRQTYGNTFTVPIVRTVTDV